MGRDDRTERAVNPGVLPVFRNQVRVVKDHQRVTIEVGLDLLKLGDDMVVEMISVEKRDANRWHGRQKPP
jgi:hypothetical protein